MQTAKQLCDQALQSSPEERMALVDQILDTLHERDSSLDAQWAQEAQSRLAAYRRGEAQAIPLKSIRGVLHDDAKTQACRPARPRFC